MSLSRLISYRGVLLTEDTARALETLSSTLSEKGWVLTPKAPLKYERGDPYSLLAAGREVRVEVSQADDHDLHTAVQVLWSACVPLGLIPKARYPLPTPEGFTLHFFGPWQVIYDRLLAEGRGHLVWPSVCCAAQVEVGVWEGGRKDIRTVQTCLHRLGTNPGDVDGVFGERTKACLQYLGFGAVPFDQVLDSVQKAVCLVPAKPADPPPEPVRGHVVISQCSLKAQGFGGVRAWNLNKNVGVEVTGPGRLVIDIVPAW